MKHLRYLAIVIAVGTIFFGCRKPAKLVLTKDQRARIQENILSEPPTPKYAINANFGDNIKLIGVDLSAEVVKPSDTMTVTYYWECLRETPGEWKVFVHLELPGGRRMILDHHPVGELYPIANWKRGEIIRDIQRFAIPSDAKGGQAVLWAGIFNEAIYREQGGGDRMELKNKDQVPNDGDNRVRVARFTIAETSGGDQRPFLEVGRAKGEIKIDGRLDEPSWKEAKPVVLKSSNGSEVEDEEKTTLLALYDDKALYIAFQVEDRSVESPYKLRDEELWNADVVEVFLDPGADGKDYLEIQVSPASVVFDALFKARRSPSPDEAKKHNVEGLLAAANVRGTLNGPKDQDQGYDVEIAIPWTSMPEGIKTPPQTVLAANFFRIDAEDGKVKGAQALAPTSDFHDLSVAALLKLSSEGAATLVPQVNPQVLAPALKSIGPGRLGGLKPGQVQMPRVEKAK